MPRQRTGTLVPKDGFYFARVTVGPKGATRRALFALNTRDGSQAEKRMKTLVADLASGRLVLPDLATEAKAKTLFADYARTWIKTRYDRKLTSAATEESILKLHVTPALGRKRLCDVRPADIAALLDAAVAKGLKSGSLTQIRATVNRVFAHAWRLEIVQSNPVSRVPTPHLNEYQKERAILTDEELIQYVTCDTVDQELRVLSFVARIQGGMRSGDLNRWDWSMIDTTNFARCTVLRWKTKRPQTLEVPELLRPILRQWWERQGSPLDGPVFPRRRGPKAGGFRKTRGHSYAAQLRRDLWRAGVRRHELHKETATSKPVDFHSFRRAFSTALAEANVSAQRAMHLAGHSDPHVHARYVMRTVAMQKIPTEALPQITAFDLPRGSGTRENNELERAKIAMNRGESASSGEGSRSSGGGGGHDDKRRVDPGGSGLAAGHPIASDPLRSAESDPETPSEAVSLGALGRALAAERIVWDSLDAFVGFEDDEDAS